LLVKITIFDVFALEEGDPSAVVISEKFPSKLGDEREVNIFHELKSQATLILWQA
jgi:hypothetical protein